MPAGYASAAVVDKPAEPLADSLATQSPTPIAGESVEVPALTKNNVRFVSGAAFMLLARKYPQNVSAVTLADLDRALTPKEHIDPLPLIPEEFRDFADVFSQRESETLPLHCEGIDCTIPLKEGAPIP